MNSVVATMPSLSATTAVATPVVGTMAAKGVTAAVAPVVSSTIATPPIAVAATPVVGIMAAKGATAAGAAAAGMNSVVATMPSLSATPAAVISVA